MLPPSLIGISFVLLCTAWTTTLAAPTQVPVSGAPIANLRNGSYYGVHNDHFYQDFFLGVPFAQPPVGELRLQVPQSLNKSWTGYHNATQYGHACYGYGEDTFIGGDNYVSEDCLTLNIVRPSGYEGQELPVAAWIYGGGFYEGTTLDPRYNLSFIVEQSVKINKPIIGVSFNYRLSGWGFLYSEEIVKAGVANLGLRDQRLALHWLQENIAAFGGNASKVTIWGESAGAMSVGLQILAYNGRDDKLFSGAIAESGPTWGIGVIDPVISIAEQVYQNVTAALGCANSTDKLACLRLVPTSEFNAVVNNSADTEDYYDLYYGPLIDNDIVARDSISQIEDGCFVKVPYILGDNSDEGTDFVPFGLNTDEDLIEYLAGYNLSNSTISDLLILYPQNSSSLIPASHPAQFNSTIGIQFKRAATLLTDLAFKGPRRLAAKSWLNHTTPFPNNNITSPVAPLYTYRFSTIPNGIPSYLSVTHFQEVAFVFHNTQGQGYPDVDAPYFGADPFGDGVPQSYFDLADLMSRMWVSFVHDGDPNYVDRKFVSPLNPFVVVFVFASLGCRRDKDMHGWLTEMLMLMSMCRSRTAVADVRERVWIHAGSDDGHCVQRDVGGAC